MFYRLTKFGQRHKLGRKALGLKAFGFDFHSSARTCVRETASSGSACTGCRLTRKTDLLISSTAAFSIVHRDFHRVKSNIRGNSNKRSQPQAQSQTTGTGTGTATSWTPYHTLSASASGRSTQSCLFGSLISRLSSSTSATRPENVMNVFDRNTKRIQRNRTALLEDPSVYDYLKEEIGFRVADRIGDVKRHFGTALDLGCGRGHVSKHILAENVGFLFQSDMAEHVLAQSEISPEVPTQKLHLDEEHLPFKDESLDLVVSSLSLHWVNNLPGCFLQINKILKADGCFMGAMFGGDTLYELRVSLQLAETEREGGFAPHISPFTSVQDLGNLLNRAGFEMLTIDIDDIIVNYPSMFELMADLKGMGENNCAWNRRLLLPKAAQKAAAEKYKEMYGNEQEGIPATFQTIHFIGWKADKSQPQPALRGSGQVSLKDLDKFDQIRKEVAKKKKKTDSSDNVHELNTTIEQLARDIEKQRNNTVGDKTNGQESGGKK